MGDVPALIATLVFAWVLWQATGTPRSRKDAALKVLVCLLVGYWAAMGLTTGSLDSIDPNAGQHM